MANNKKYADEMLQRAYVEHYTRLEKYCRVRLREAVDFTEDCIQEAFCVYYQKLLDGVEFENVRAFLYRTADVMIKRAREKYIKEASKTAPIEDAEQIEAAEVDRLADNLDYDLLKMILLTRLTSDELVLYESKYVKRMSLKEIGEMLGIPPTTVANRTSRLRTKIKNLCSELINDIES